MPWRLPSAGVFGKGTFKLSPKELGRGSLTQERRGSMGRNGMHVPWGWDERGPL